MSESRQVFPVDFDERIRLMGHHHLCLMGFEGLRKEPEFRAAYAPILERTDVRPEITVETIFGYDVFCYDCPFWSDDAGACDTGWQDKISKDAAVLKILGIHVGERHSFAELQQRLATRLTVQHFTELCGPGPHECAWFPMGHCLDGLKVLKRQFGVPLDE